MVKMNLTKMVGRPRTVKSSVASGVGGLKGCGWNGEL